MGTGGPTGLGDKGARPVGVGAPPTLLARVWAPHVFFRSIILINSKNMFRGVSGFLELCRIGFQYLLLFQPEFQLPAFPLFMVNLVK